MWRLLQLLTCGRNALTTARSVWKAKPGWVKKHHRHPLPYLQVPQCRQSVVLQNCLFRCHQPSIQQINLKLSRQLLWRHQWQSCSILFTRRECLLTCSGRVEASRQTFSTSSHVCLTIKDICFGHLSYGLASRNFSQLAGKKELTRTLSLQSLSYQWPYLYHSNSRLPRLYSCQSWSLYST